MGDVTPHPGFRDVLWHFAALPEASQFRIRVCPSEEELFEAENVMPEGEPWTVPSGVTRNRRPGSPYLLDPGEAIDVGAKLWSSLPDRVRASLPPPAGTRVRLKISGDSDWITSLPWEGVRAAAPAVLVVRSVPVRYPLPPVTVAPPLRVLLVTTNPRDERLLNPGEEIAAVSPVNLPDYVTKVCEEPTRRGVAEALQSFQPHVLHYVGHGAMSSGQGCLVLHDEHNHTCWLGASDLARLLPVSVRLLCLSTCLTAANNDVRALVCLANAPPDLTLPTAVVNQSGLDRGSQPAVREFWNVFYRELSGAGDASSAFAAAQAVIGASSAWPAFSQILRDGTGWSLRVTDGAPSPDLAQAEFEALYSTSIANYVVQQKGAQPSGARTGLEGISRHEAQRATAALSPFGGFRLGGRRKS